MDIDIIYGIALRPEWYMEILSEGRSSKPLSPDTNSDDALSMDKDNCDSIDLEE